MGWGGVGWGLSCQTRDGLSTLVMSAQCLPK